MNREKESNTLAHMTIGLYETLENQLKMIFQLSVKTRLLQETIKKCDSIPNDVKDKIIPKFDSSYNNSIDYLEKTKELVSIIKEFSEIMLDSYKDDEDKLEIEKEEDNRDGRKERFYFTFGQVHKHTVKGIEFNRNTVVIINAINEHAARDVMFKFFKDKWAFCYSEKDWVKNDMKNNFETIYKLK